MAWNGGSGICWQKLRRGARHCRRVRYGIGGDDIEQRVDALLNGAEHWQFHCWSLMDMDICEFDATLVGMFQALIWINLRCKP
jgi:hypothetical protein